MTGCLLLQSYGYLWEYLGDSWNWVPAHASDSRFSPLLEFIAKSLVYIVKFMLGITPPCSDFSIFSYACYARLFHAQSQIGTAFEAKATLSPQASLSLWSSHPEATVSLSNCGPLNCEYINCDKKNKDRNGIWEPHRIADSYNLQHQVHQVLMALRTFAPTKLSKP